MNFYESHSHVWFLGRLLGSFHLKYHKNQLRFTNISLLSALVFIVSLLFAVFIIRYEKEDQSTYGIQRSVLYSISVFKELSLAMNCIVTFIDSFKKRKKSLKFFKKLFEFDTIIKAQLNIHFDYKRLRQRHTRRLKIISIFFFIISAAIISVYILNVTYIPLAIVYSFTYGSAFTASFDYYYCTKLIKYRFKALNNKLIEEINLSKISPCKLQVMIKCHFTLNDLIKDINEIHGFKKLMTISNDFTLIVSQLYALFISINSNFSSYIHIQYLFELLTMPYIVINLVVTAKVCQETISCKNMFGKLLKGCVCNGVVFKLVFIVIIFFGVYKNKLFSRLIILDYTICIMMLNLQLTSFLQLT